MLATLKAPKFFRDVANSCPLPMELVFRIKDPFLHTRIRIQRLVN